MTQSSPSVSYEMLKVWQATIHEVQVAFQTLAGSVQPPNLQAHVMVSADQGYENGVTRLRDLVPALDFYVTECPDPIVVEIVNATVDVEDLRNDGYAIVDTDDGVMAVDPDCVDSVKTSLYSVIIHLNDYHRWTREQIADWLDGLSVNLTIRNDS